MYTLIDSPITPYSTLAEIDAWIEELKARPQDDQGVQRALEYAQHIRDLVERGP